MKYIITLFLIFGLVSVCYAERVCVQKSTGKLIEYQSGNVNDLMADGTLPPEEIKENRLNSLKQNAINAGYPADDIEVKEITPQEWEKIKYEQMTKPAQELARQRELERQIAESEIKIKLNLSDEYWQKLKKAFK